MRVMQVLPTGFAVFLLAGAAAAQSPPLAPPSGTAAGAECDRLAADPLGSHRSAHGFGVDLDKIDTTTAIPACERALAADPGNARLQHLLGRAIYASGRHADGLAWYREAAEQGHADAQVSLGRAYLSGFGVPPSAIEAIAWYRRAAAQGHADAQFRLGFIYAQGQGVPQSDAEAVAWYRKAANKGHTGAQNLLGGMYEEGRGVPQDDAEAVALYRQAAERGDAGAQYSMGRAYERGLGVQRSDGEAETWYRKAADQGYSFAREKLAALEARKAEPAAMFGIRMGQPLSELTAVSTDSANVYFLSHVPDPHPLLSSYTATVSDRDGVCGITAMAIGVPENEARSISGSIFQELTARYGPPSITEQESGNALWNEPKSMDAMSLSSFGTEGTRTVALNIDFPNIHACKAK